MNLKTSLLILGIAVAASACKKKEGDNTKLDPNNNTSIEGYMSTKAGSWWLYNTSESKILKRTATGLTKEKDGFVYDLYKMVDTTSSMQEEIDDFFAKNEENYISLLDLDGSQTNYVRAIIYKENAPIGNTWENTHTMSYSGLNFDILITSEIKGVNETKVINGVTYDSVFVTYNKLQGRQLPLFPLWQDCGYVELWFKRGVGILKREYDISILNVFSRTYHDEILSYHIAP